MIKKSLLIFLVLLSCAQKRYTLIPTISGNVLDANGRPLVDATVDVYKPNGVPINIGIVVTDDSGRFVKEGMWEADFHNYFVSRKYISHVLIIQKEGYATDTVDILKYIQRDAGPSDTFDIGDIYLNEIAK